MKNYILLWVCLWCAGQLCAETAVSKSLDINIVGHVLDKNTREHLPYISVVLKGTTIGVMTDASGHYFLKNLPEGDFFLETSSVGYKKIPTPTLWHKDLIFSRVSGSRTIVKTAVFNKSV